MKKKEIRELMYHEYCSGWYAGFDRAKRGKGMKHDMVVKAFRRAWLRIGRKLGLVKEE